MLKIKELSKEMDRVFDKDLILFTKGTRKDTNEDKTRKLGKYQAYGLKSSKSSLSNSQVYDKVVDKKEMEKNTLKMVIKEIIPRFFLKEKQLINGIQALARRSYLKSQKTKKKKDRQAPKGIWSGQVFKSLTIGNKNGA